MSKRNPLRCRTVLKQIVLLGIFQYLILFAAGQLPSFDSRLIPEELKKNASVVKRYEEISFDVRNISEGTLNVTQVLTVLNERGREALVFHQPSNKFISLGDVEIKVFDAEGKQTDKYKRKDLVTIASGEGLIEDGKMTYFFVSNTNYPITVEYKYSVQFEGTLIYPSYEIMTPGQSVEYSSFTTRVPANLDLRYQAKNIQLPPEVGQDGNYKTYHWTVKNLPPIYFEEGAVSYESRYPSILLAPNHFKIDEFEGDMTSWKQFGLWYYSLKKGLDVLPDDRKVFFRDMVKNIPGQREKIQAIYDYLQKNFRYVSIQLGAIGGFRPFPASFTDQKKYGDCKGLSNYMQAALDAVGIKSYQALINAEYNREPVDPDFPCNLFNHVIICVPQQGDSIWLECTSKTNDFGVLGSFTENRNALLITEMGGVLVQTPKSKSSNNTISLKTVIELSEDGSGKSTTEIISKGQYKNDLVHYVVDQKEDNQKKFLMNYLGFKQPDLFTISQKDTTLFTVEVKSEIEKIPEMVTHDKMFLPLRIYKVWSSSLPRAEDRKQDFYFECPFRKIDTTIYQLPPGFEPDAMPKDQEKTTAFGAYSTHFWWDKKINAIYSVCELVLNQYKIPAANYASVKNFFDQVIIENAQRIVIKRQ